MYVFFDESDSEVTMTLSYSISNFVQVYDDVAEVYWQYIGHGWAVDSDHVTTTLTVPVAAGAQVRATMCAHGAMVRSTEACPLAMMARFMRRSLR